MNYSKIFILFLFLVFNSNVLSQEKIIGAFGIELGQVFNPSSAIGEASLTDGTPLYQFNPEKKFRSFSDYYVLITPQSNKVHTIWATGNFENDPTCKKEQELVMAIIQKKYGEAEKDGLISNMYDVKQVVQGKKRIITKCTGFTDVSLDIRYKDMELNEIADKERILIESEKVDSSGL